MQRTATVLAAILVVVGTLGAVPATGLAQTATTDGGPDTATPTATPDGTDDGADENATAPGDLLEGVLGVQEAEIEGEIENRTFGIRVAQAATADAKADVVAERLAEIEERLRSLEERKEELNESRRNGSISEAEYRNEIAELAVRTNNTKQLIDRSANVSEGLPNETLASKGINVTAIRTLADRANELTGPEVSEIARSIAGPSVAAEASDGASDRRGPPGDSGNRTAGASDDRGEPPEEGNASEGSPGADERPEGDDGETAEPTERPEGDDGETAEPTERPEGDDGETAEPTERPDDDDDGSNDAPSRSGR